MAAILVQDDLADLPWIEAHVDGYPAVAEVLRRVPVGDYCRVADVDEALVRAAVGRIAGRPQWRSTRTSACR